MSEKINANKRTVAEPAKQETWKIVLTEPKKFEGDMKTNIISSIEMADIISSLFSSVFNDYYGCNVRVNDGHASPVVTNSLPYGAIYVDLYFKDQPAQENLLKNIEPYAKDAEGKPKDPNSLGARFTRMNGSISTGRVYSVSKETYEALAEFMPTGPFRWNEHTQEISTPMGVYSKEEVVVCISGLDLNKIITKIYGDRTDETTYEYIATPSTIIPSRTSEFIMQVTQLDIAIVRELQQVLGVRNYGAPEFHRYVRR